MDKYDHQIKIICQLFYVVVTSSGMNREIIYITFLNSGMSTLGLYPEYVVPEFFYLQWPARNKM